MNKIFLIILKERIRRLKAALKNNPILVVGGIGMIASALSFLWKKPENIFSLTAILNEKIAVLCIMGYLVAKIINPTQGMTTDYQLLQLKLITFRAYKCIMAVKLFGGSVLLLLLGLPLPDRNLVIICAMNATVNLWIFLRNRWNSRLIDLCVSIFVICCVRYQLFIASLVGLSVAVGVYIFLKHINYSEILPLYKLMYQVGQQRYLGADYSEKECRMIQDNAEKLVGKAKAKNTSWCEKIYENDRLFYIAKEFARVSAGKNSLIAYLMINIMVGIGAFYIPGGYLFAAYGVLALIAVNYCLSMNRSEAKLLKRGFIGRYSIGEIFKNKLPVYSVMTFVLMLPAGLWGIKWLGANAVLSFLAAMIVIYKCFHDRKHVN